MGLDPANSVRELDACRETTRHSGAGTKRLRAGKFRARGEESGSQQQGSSAVIAMASRHAVCGHGKPGEGGRASWRLGGACRGQGTARRAGRRQREQGRGQAKSCVAGEIRGAPWMSGARRGEEDPDARLAGSRAERARGEDELEEEWAAR
jgi:hypothetical protein